MADYIKQPTVTEQQKTIYSGKETKERQIFDIKKERGMKEGWVKQFSRYLLETICNWRKESPKVI